MTEQPITWPELAYRLSHCDECGCEHGQPGGYGRCECECHDPIPQGETP